MPNLNLNICKRRSTLLPNSFKYSEKESNDKDSCNISFKNSDKPKLHKMQTKSLSREHSNGHSDKKIKRSNSKFQRYSTYSENTETINSISSSSYKLDLNSSDNALIDRLIREKDSLYSNWI